MSGSASSIFSKRSHFAARGLDRRVLREPQIDEQLRAVGGGEELLLARVPNSDDATATNAAAVPHDHQAAPLQRTSQRAAKPARAAAFRRMCAMLRGLAAP